MTSIDYYVHGRGRGHASRALWVAPALLKAGHKVRVFAGRDAYDYLQGSSLHSKYPQIELVSVESMPPRFDRKTPGLLLSRVLEARRSAKKHKTTAIITDGDAPAAWAAKLMGLPSVAVGHGLVFSHCNCPPGMDQAAWRREARKAHIASWGTSSQVAVNFTSVQPRSASTIVAKPRVELNAESKHDASEYRAGNLGEQGVTVLCYLRDGFTERNAANLAIWANELSTAYGATLVMFGDNAPELSGAISHSPQRDKFVAEMTNARLVISSAGSQLTSECLFLGIPQFALFKDGDDEQQLNVEMLKEGHLGNGCAFKDVTREKLASFFAASLSADASGRPKVFEGMWVDEAVVSAVSAALNRTARPRSN